MQPHQQLQLYTEGPALSAAHLEEGNLQVIVGLPLFEVLLDGVAGSIAGRLPAQPPSQTFLQAFCSLQHPVKESGLPRLERRLTPKEGFPLASASALSARLLQLRIAVERALEQLGGPRPVLGEVRPHPVSVEQVERGYLARA